MKLNPIHLNRFKLTGSRYLIQVKRGLFLSFDKDTLEYIGLEMFYSGNYVIVDKLATAKLEELIAKDFVLL